MEVLAQILSIIGMVGTIFAFQIKKTSHFCIASVCTCTLFAASYFLLGSPTSAIINLVCALRGIFASNKRTRKDVFFVIVCVMIAVSMAFTYVGILSLLVCAAELAGTYGMWFASEKGIRKIRVFFQSPLWLINNIIVFTVGGILCEVFTMISAIIFLLRFRDKKI